MTTSSSTLKEPRVDLILFSAQASFSGLTMVKHENSQEKDSVKASSQIRNDEYRGVQIIQA